MNKPAFLIDINLPYYFALWNSVDYLHQADLGLNWPDEEIWSYAKAQNLTIVSKDSDFSNRILFNSPPPKVIHIKLGNTRMREFYEILHQVWPQVLEMNQEYKLVNVFKNRLEGIN